MFYPKKNLRRAAGILSVMYLAGPLQVQAQPVNISGKISSIYQQIDSNTSGATSSNWLNLATISANGYIWQPWFALISGSLSLVSSERDSESSNQSESETVEGSFQFNLFPTSRFPFVLYGSRSRFDQDSVFIDRLYTVTTIGMQQNYASLDGKQSYFASYRTQQRDDLSEGSDRSSEAFTFGASARFEENSISSTISHSSNREVSVEEDSDSTFVLGHSYFGVDDLSLNNRLSLSQSDDQFRLLSNELDTKQLTSFASWRPNSSKDLNITGSLRASTRDGTFINENTLTPTIRDEDRTSLNLAQGLTYRLNDNFTFSESINISSNEQQGDKNASYFESVGVGYQPDVLILENGEYNWFASTNLTNQHGDSFQSIQSLDSQVAHNYRKKFFLSPEIAIDARFGQSLAYIVTSTGGNSDQLGNSASFSWSDFEDASATTARFSVSDSRSFEENTNRQLYNFQANQRHRLGRARSVSTDITLQKSRDSSPNGTAGVTLIAAQVDYNDTRFLNQFGLTYRSLVKISDQEPDLGTLNPNTRRANSLSWENDWFYRIGLFESRLSFDYIKSDDGYNTIIIIELTRNFGGL